MKQQLHQRGVGQRCGVHAPARWERTKLEQHSAMDVVLVASMNMPTKWTE